MERNMIYNTEQAMLVLPEYGREIQDLIEYCCEIEDKSERQLCAESIVRIMATIVQEKYASPDVQRKLWNHLAQMSHWELEIDYPVEIDQPEELSHPAPMPYPNKSIKRREFGSLLEQTMSYVNTLPRSEERDVLSQQVDELITRAIATASDERGVNGEGADSRKRRKK